MEQSFLPQDYQAPASGGFFKFENGENKLRIITNPVFLWVIWANGEAKRIPYLDAAGKPVEKPAKGAGDKDSVNFAWGVGVYNYKTRQVEVAEITQKGIQSQLESYSKNPAWGHPRNYNLNVSKKGGGLDTEYTVTVDPPSALPAEALQAVTDTPLDLNQLFVSGGNPFVQAGGSVASTPPAAAGVKVVTAENWVLGDPVPAGYSLGADGRTLVKMPF